MIITVKNLQQQTFTVEFNAEKTVLELKEKIFKERGSEYVVEKQKLIYAGVILEDKRSISSYNVDDKKFIVVMLKRELGGAPKSEESGATACSKTSAGNEIELSPTTVTTNTQEKNVSDEDMKPVSSSDNDAVRGSAKGTTASRSESSQSTGFSDNITGVTTSLQSRAESNLLMGEEYNRSVESMIEMGYSRELVERAMAASFNNPERAVEYLISGIPETSESFNAPTAGNEQPAIEPNIPEVEGQENLSTSHADPFESLRSQPQFLQMRYLVSQNPDLLHAVFQQIGQTNPALLQLISENQDAFLNMLNEPIEGQPTVRSNPHRLTPGRRTQLASAARGAAGDGLHVRPLETTSGAGGDGPPRRQPDESGDAGRDTISHDMLPHRPDRPTDSRAAEALISDRAVAASVAELTAAAERNASVGGGNGFGGGSLGIRSLLPQRNLLETSVTRSSSANTESTTTIRLSNEDREAVERLKALGFPEPLVLQAYFACEKDEQLAANFLISSAFDD